MKLAKMAFLYCGVFVKNSNVQQCSMRTESNDDAGRTGGCHALVSIQKGVMPLCLQQVLDVLNQLSAS